MGEMSIPYRKEQSYRKQLSTECRLQNVYKKKKKDTVHYTVLTVHYSTLQYTVH
jgi:hypothetical protein